MGNLLYDMNIDSPNTEKTETHNANTLDIYKYITVFGVRICHHPDMHNDGIRQSIISSQSWSLEHLPIPPIQPATFHLSPSTPQKKTVPTSFSSSVYEGPTQPDR